MSFGNIVGIIGTVVDAQFPCTAVPKVYDALKIENGLNPGSASAVVFDCVCLIAWASRMGHVAVRRNTMS